MTKGWSNINNAILTELDFYYNLNSNSFSLSSLNRNAELSAFLQAVYLGCDPGNTVEAVDKVPEEAGG